jgi:hypothetical protein
VAACYLYQSGETLAGDNLGELFPKKTEAVQAG